MTALLGFINFYEVGIALLKCINQSTILKRKNVTHLGDGLWGCLEHTFREGVEQGRNICCCAKINRFTLSQKQTSGKLKEKHFLEFLKILNNKVDQFA